MPAISQIGFGTNDYATIEAWLSAEGNNDYSGSGIIAEIQGSIALSANLQIRLETTSSITIRAATGSEFDGNLGGTHAKITGGYNFDPRRSNISINNIDCDFTIESSGDTYEALNLDGSLIRGSVYLDKAVTTAVSLTGSMIYTATATNNRALYINGSDVDADGLTVVATNATTPYGAIYVRNNASTVSLNNVAVYAAGNDSYEIHSGDTPTVTGDYNASEDGLLPDDASNSIATLGTDDFVDYASLDFRIASSSELVGAGSGGGDIGGFVEVATPSVTSVDTDNRIHKSQTTFTSTHPNTPTASSYEYFIDSNSCPFVSRVGDLFTWTLPAGVKALANGSYNTLFRYIP